MLCSSQNASSLSLILCKEQQKREKRKYDWNARKYVFINILLLLDNKIVTGVYEVLVIKDFELSNVLKGTCNIRHKIL